MNRERKAVVLLSGGLDSTTTLYIAKSEGFRIYALSFMYGQRHTCELRCASESARRGQVEDHLTVSLDPRLFTGSSLTGQHDIPLHRDASEILSGIPSTYVPARNTIFLAIALGWAEVLGAGDVFAGVNAVDYSGYPDCRPEFIDAFRNLAKLATKAAVEGKPTGIHTPLLHMRKAEIIRKGLELGVDYSMTLSCYNPDENGRSCGACDACTLRLAGFRENGIEDPAEYYG
jgi:7-cyano-7-deazaguanine synthase